MLIVAGRFGFEYALATPFLLVLIALFLGNDETPIVLGDSTFVVRPLRVALFFAAIDLVLIAILWLSGVISFRF